MFNLLFTFGWIKKRKVRKLVQKEVSLLQVRAAELYFKLDYQKSPDDKLAAAAKEYEEIAQMIEQHIIFLVITRDIN